MFELKMASNTQACNSFSFEYLTLWPNFVVKLYRPTLMRLYLTVTIELTNLTTTKLAIRFEPNHSCPNLKSPSLAAVSTGPSSQGPLGQITRIPGPPPGPGANICALVSSRRAGGRRTQPLTTHSPRSSCSSTTTIHFSSTPLRPGGHDNKLNSNEIHEQIKLLSLMYACASSNRART